MSGKIFFGQPDTTLTFPETGFMYDPATKTISSKNKKVIIDSNGQIIADSAQFTNSNITGTATINDGFFSGGFDCGSIKTEVVDKEVEMTINVLAADGIYQAKNIYNLKQTGICKINNTTVARFEGKYSSSSAGSTTALQYSIMFYDSTGKQLTLDEIGIPYSAVLGIKDQLIYMYQDEAWGQSSERGTYWTQDVNIEVYSGWNSLLLDVVGAQGGGAQKEDIKSLNLGGLYVDDHGFVRAKISADFYWVLNDSNAQNYLEWRKRYFD